MSSPPEWTGNVRRRNAMYKCRRQKTLVNAHGVIPLPGRVFQPAKPPQEPIPPSRLQRQRGNMPTPQCSAFYPIPYIICALHFHCPRHKKGVWSPLNGPVAHSDVRQRKATVKCRKLIFFHQPARILQHEKALYHGADGTNPVFTYRCGTAESQTSTSATGTHSTPLSSSPQQQRGPINPHPSSAESLA
jgi:hypothetical protein